MFVGQKKMFLNEEARKAPQGPVRILIHESEIQAVCRKGLEHEDEETGGQFYGAYLGSGTVIVMLATPAGPLSEACVGSFVQDHEYCCETAEHLLTHFGVGAVGRHHSHHKLGLQQPSGGDRATAFSIRSKNPFPVFVEVITTHDQRGRTIAVHPFVYLDGHGDQPYPAEIVVIPGISPIREVCFGTVVFPTPEMYQWRLPMDRIKIDAVSGAAPARPAIPRSLIEQVEALPSALRSSVRACREDDAISLQIPLPTGGEIYVGYSADAPSLPAVVLVKADAEDEPEDVTEIVNPDAMEMTLAELCAHLLSACPGHHPEGWSKSRGRLYERAGLDDYLAESHSKGGTRSGPGDKVHADTPVPAKPGSGEAPSPNHADHNSTAKKKPPRHHKRNKKHYRRNKRRNR